MFCGAFFGRMLLFTLTAPLHVGIHVNVQIWVLANLYYSMHVIPEKVEILLTIINEVVITGNCTYSFLERDQQ